MNQHFRCPTCGQIDLITYRAADVGSLGWPPRCSGEETHPSTPMEMAPQQMLTDLRSDSDSDTAFRKFSISVDGQRVEVSSLSQMRTIERESEQRYRNGEGEPIRFRMWNQDRSNKDVNAFGDAGTIGEHQYSNGRQPAKSGKIGVRRYGEEKPRVKVAKGAGQTALKG